MRAPRNSGFLVPVFRSLATLSIVLPCVHLCDSRAGMVLSNSAPAFSVSVMYVKYNAIPQTGAVLSKCFATVRGI